jgi:hypothetical protein
MALAAGTGEEVHVVELLGRSSLSYLAVFQYIHPPKYVSLDIYLTTPEITALRLCAISIPSHWAFSGEGEIRDTHTLPSLHCLVVGNNSTPGACSGAADETARATYYN